MQSRIFGFVGSIILGLAAAATCGASEEPTLPGGAHTRSWIAVDASCAQKTLVEGDTWEVQVDYYLDPAEESGGTSLTMWVAGPWIDTPDGKYAKERGHISYPGMYGKAPAKPGRNRHVFKFTVPPALPHNRLLIICEFEDKEGNKWHWQVRRDGPWFKRKGGYFELEISSPANLFRYEDPVVINARLKRAALDGGNRQVSYKVYDVKDAVVAQGVVPFKCEREGQMVPIHLNLKRRGTFYMEAGVDGWEKRSITFCRIPDVPNLTKGARTPFGVTNVVVPAAPDRLEELCRAARKMGFSFCRSFAAWYGMEPGPGVYSLDEWKRALSVGKREGIETWLCIYEPPAWALRGRMDSFNTDYRSVRCDWNAWRDFIQTAGTAFKGNLAGWEWLNEITPGGSESPVDDYLTLCRIGTQTAKRVDPTVTTVMAGGLWPRSYRLEMLKAGVGKWVDALPIHYSNGDGIREAREDLDVAGRSQAAVWDNESAKGINAWSVPPLEELANTAQSEWVLDQWTDELSAGAEKLFYFGGEGDPCGNYSYLLDDLTPRPVAATLAVFTSKMARAHPLGVFTLGKAGLFHLFERDGVPVLVCSSRESSEEVNLRVGSQPVILTDYQGNEQKIPASGGFVRLRLAPLRYYLEGGDLDVLKSYVACEVSPQRNGSTISRPADAPRATVIRGKSETIYVKVRNLFGRPLSVRVRIETPAGWPAQSGKTVAMKAGEMRMIPLSLVVPANINTGEYPVNAVFRFSWTKLPGINKPFILSVVSPDMVGNLLPNGGFEEADASSKSPLGWSVNGTTSLWKDSAGLGDGLGSYVLEFAGSPAWVSTGRSVDLRGGNTYLYTAWIWNNNMHAGSNIGQEMADGTSSQLFDQQVFNAGTDNGGWQTYACHYQAPVGLKRASFVPVAQGDGWARYDNLRLTLYDGTDYAAECVRCKTPPRIDGLLDDWDTSCPIPLIGRNQLTVLDASYRWTPNNLSAVGYLMWDDANLYVAVSVRDDVHHPTGYGETVVNGDGVVLAVDPTNRAPGADLRAFAYYLSAAVPGGGSGKATLYRPAVHSGGLRSGHLIKDSSIYDMAIHRGEGVTIYELRLPFTELGGLRPSEGGKWAFSIQANDNDGAGLCAHMNWGEGIAPVWRPASFGVVTFTKTAR